MYRLIGESALGAEPRRDPFGTRRAHRRRRRRRKRKRERERDREMGERERDIYIWIHINQNPMRKMKDIPIRNQVRFKGIGFQEFIRALVELVEGLRFTDSGVGFRAWD